MYMHFATNWLFDVLKETSYVLTYNAKLLTWQCKQKGQNEKITIERKKIIQALCATDLEAHLTPCPSMEPTKTNTTILNLRKSKVWEPTRLFWTWEIQKFENQHDYFEPEKIKSVWTNTTILNLRKSKVCELTRLFWIWENQKCVRNSSLLWASIIMNCFLK